MSNQAAHQVWQCLRARRGRRVVIGIIVGTAAGGSVLFASLASGASTGRAQTRLPR